MKAWKVAGLLFLMVFSLPVALAQEAIEPGMLYPVERIYPLLETQPMAEVWPTAEDWAKAFPARGFFLTGALEPEGRETTLRMLKNADRLFVSIECASPEAVDEPESVEFYLPQSNGKPDFPCLAVEATQNGDCRAVLIRYGTGWWEQPDGYPITESIVPRQVSQMPGGWKVEFSLPLREFAVSTDDFRFNAVRRLGPGQRHAWADLAGGPSNQFAVYARALPLEEAGLPRNALVLPAPLRVGLNRLSLEHPDAQLRLKAGGQTLTPDAEGSFQLTVARRGPLDLQLTDVAGNPVAAYHADIRRPLIIDAPTRYLTADAQEFDLTVQLNVAGEDDTDIAITCVRGEAQESHKVQLKPGVHSIKLPVPAGDSTDVQIMAKAAVPSGFADVISLEARHWFAAGISREDSDVYRNGIIELPTDRLYWAVLADAMPFVILDQQGDGAYTPVRDDRWSRLWPQMAVLGPALLYKTDHPDNPWFGDKRLLNSAILGMEYALRPEIRMDEYSCPDSRSPHAFLLTYDLLKNDIDPETREYWAGELQHVAEGEVQIFLRRLIDKYTFYSIDCATSTNHMAFHVANVYLAGQLFNRPEWIDISRQLMLRLARHGEKGYFEEQKGSPANHYMWLTADALGQYYWRSKDDEVLPTLVASARYMSAITTAQGGTMALHDSRSSMHSPYRYGEYVLSLLPEGRPAARARLLAAMRGRPSNIRGEFMARTAENAMYFSAGPETDLFGGERELPFDYGILVRKDGFHYALSTMERGAVSGNYVLDAQNVIEMFHKDAGCILNGGNSQSQPEAGNFFRALNEPDWAGKTTATSNDYLPTAATLAQIPNGHELLLGYRTFEGSMSVQIFSDNKARVTAMVNAAEGPVIFNFFPGAHGDEIIPGEDGQSLRFGKVTIKADMPFQIETDFKMLNPYNMRRDYTHKPVRCWVELDNTKPVALDIIIETD